MNIHINRTPVNVVLVVVVAVSLVLLWTAMPVQQSEVITKEIPAEIQEDQILDLATLPENMVLPNGMILEKVALVNEGSLAGTISAIAIFEKEASPLKMTWLDENGNEISYSSHTVLNSPPFGVENSGDQINIHPLFKAQKVKFESWE